MREAKERTAQKLLIQRATVVSDLTAFERVSRGTAAPRHSDFCADLSVNMRTPEHQKLSIADVKNGRQETTERRTEVSQPLFGGCPVSVKLAQT